MSQTANLSGEYLLNITLEDSELVLFTLAHLHQAIFGSHLPAWIFNFYFSSNTSKRPKVILFYGIKIESFIDVTDE